MKTVAIVSGGLDSVTMLYKFLDEGRDVKVLSFNYGQRHKKELVCAQKLTAKLGLDHKVLELSNLAELLGGSSQTDSSIPVPEGHYSADSMAVTVVPNRNSIMLNIAHGWAIKLGYDTVSFGAHLGDRAQYADCRIEFAEAQKKVFSLADYRPAVLEYPFIDLTKAQIAEFAARLSVPIAETWSCYKGGDIHCGRCGTDVERIEALYLAGVTDPTEYEDSEFWKTACGLTVAPQ